MRCNYSKGGYDRRDNDCNNPRRPYRIYPGTDFDRGMGCPRDMDCRHPDHRDMDHRRIYHRKVLIIGSPRSFQ